MTRRCATCGAKLPLMARSCLVCGAANPIRRTMLGVAAVVAVLAPAIAIAIYAATRWDQPLISGDRPADLPLPAQPAAGTSDDFSWLSAAMKQCDEKAAGEPNALHFLVIPLAFDAKELEQWRRLALNRIGNAMVLPGDDTLSGLRRKALSIDTGEYVFSIRDERNQAVRKWAPATGVKWLSIADAEGVAALRMQFKPRDKGSEDNWGNIIAHRAGNCYWINAAYEE